MEKEIKQKKNNILKEPEGYPEEKLKKKLQAQTDDDLDSSPSFQKIRDLFRKTEEMKEIAKEKNKDVENQFVTLRERLNSSAAFLNQMKSSIENLKFSYQRKMLEKQDEYYEDYLKNREKFKDNGEMDNYLEEVREKIQTLQMKPKSVQEDEGPQDYQSALKDVVENLRKINEGTYATSGNFEKDNI